MNILWRCLEWEGKLSEPTNKASLSYVNYFSFDVFNSYMETRNYSLTYTVATTMTTIHTQTSMKNEKLENNCAWIILIWKKEHGILVSENTNVLEILKEA